MRRQKAHIADPPDVRREPTPPLPQLEGPKLTRPGTLNMRDSLRLVFGRTPKAWS